MAFGITACDNWIKYIWYLTWIYHQINTDKISKKIRANIQDVLDAMAKLDKMVNLQYRFVTDAGGMARVPELLSVLNGLYRYDELERKVNRLLSIVEKNSENIDVLQKSVVCLPKSSATTIQLPSVPMPSSSVTSRPTSPPPSRCTNTSSCAVSTGTVSSIPVPIESTGSYTRLIPVFILHQNSVCI